ncbi:MAG TPA: Gfo/Idh/MocA family oxidoreductase [Candidatus Limnocylindria bacterium]
MRVAVIGAGSMGGKHAQLLAGLPDVNEVLVVDAVRSRAESVARDVGGRALGHDAALDAADAVVIATPAHLHAATVDATIARGIPALCEKPLTDDASASAALVERVEGAGAHVEVGFQRRHDPAYAAARAIVSDGRAGRVHLLRLTAFDPRVTPRAITDWPSGDTAPVFLHSSIHDFDFVRWMSGQEVVEVTAEGSHRDGSRPEDARGIESAVVTMRCSEGTLAVLEATWLHPLGYDNRVELVGDELHLTMGLSPRTPATHIDWDGAASSPWGGYLERFETAYRNELIAFVAAARGERPPSSTARDGLEAHRIAIAATRAYVERRPVRLDEVSTAEREVA